MKKAQSKNSKSLGAASAALFAEGDFTAKAQMSQVVKGLTKKGNGCPNGCPASSAGETDQKLSEK